MKDFYVTVKKIGVATISAETPEEAQEKAEAMKPEDFNWSKNFEVTDIH